MKIEWTEPAFLDLDGIRDYIARDSEYYASQFIGRIIEAVEKLERFPEMGRLAPDAGAKNIRELLFQHYRIIYRVEVERILVLTVIHCGRDLSRKQSKPWDIV
jgi:toxin ParE1/3/4